MEAALVMRIAEAASVYSIRPSRRLRRILPVSLLVAATPLLQRLGTLWVAASTTSNLRLLRHFMEYLRWRCLLHHDLLPSLRLRLHPHVGRRARVGGSKAQERSPHAALHQEGTL